VISESQRLHRHQLKTEQNKTFSKVPKIMKNFKTTIGLEIHVQLATKSKMFCRCDNQSFAEATDDKQSVAIKPNTLVCPVCLGLPGALPVANKTAIEWTIKTGLALNCEIPATAKFDRKHYFYPDLPKGYQISQYDEPFASRGWLKLKVKSEKSTVEDEVTIRLNRIHLEEDAGKLIHKNGTSLVDLNRAGTPLMEIVTEPDITSPAMAGDFLRKLQKIVRDVVEVSEASMEKGHLRCDANISVRKLQVPSTQYRGETEIGSELGTRNSEPIKMSQIIEIKNLNSFRFIEKALTKAEEKLKSEYPAWPAKLTKETWGYNSNNDSIYLQRAKEEAADYRYFPEPDLPPVKSAEFDLDKLKELTKENMEVKVAKLQEMEVPNQYIAAIVSNRGDFELFDKLVSEAGIEYAPEVARLLVQKSFGKTTDFSDREISELAKLVVTDTSKKNLLSAIKFILSGKSFDDAMSEINQNQTGEDEILKIVEKVLIDNPAEFARYKVGEKKLFGFFVGAAIRESKGSADPQLVNRILKEKL